MLLVLGCSSQLGPAPTIQNYLLAVADGRNDQAWALLSKLGKQKFSRSDHDAHVKGLTPAQRKSLKQAALKLKNGEISLSWSHASSALSIGTVDGRHWQIHKPLMGQTLLGTPQGAFQTFVRSFQKSDFATLFKLVPKGKREGLTVEKLQDRFSSPNLRSEVITAIEALHEVGTGFELEPGKWRFEKNGHEADFVNEDGVWRLWNLR
ncbi:MAG TPA: hypothetical protein EYN66_22875 [Myxococcales bacterium]|nr:hypothetical protein [Myxococcales bacterium]